MTKQFSFETGETYVYVILALVIVPTDNKVQEMVIVRSVYIVGEGDPHYATISLNDVGGSQYLVRNSSFEPLEHTMSTHINFPLPPRPNVGDMHATTKENLIVASQLP